MQRYDATLKLILQRLAPELLEKIIGFRIVRWHNVELPEVRNLRLDLLGETADGRLIHIELQSTNDGDIALRMAEYALAIFRRYGQMPQQIVLYVGPEPASMKTRIDGPHLSYGCQVIDIRDLDGDSWLANSPIEDNVMAVLMRFASQTEAIRKILTLVGAADRSQRSAAMAELLILAGLRKTGGIIEREVQQMPIMHDILDHEILGPAIRRGLQQGLEQGLQQGVEIGRNEGERRLALMLLAQRFGPVPDWAKNRVESMPEADVERVALSLAGAGSLEDLLN